MPGMRTVVSAALGLTLLSCGSPDPAQEATQGASAPGTAEGVATSGGASSAVANSRAVATLQTAQGAAAGTATASMTGGRIMVALEVQGMPAGHHGAHVHVTGRCDSPKFESAGGHWNPANAQHGLENEKGQHAGDMPNLAVGQDGRGSLNYELKGGSFEQLLDADGAALVIHAKADDQRTDPSGNSGDRIACGVFKQA